ncbi:phage holin family protein [Flectobacillus major]|uniref:phage holin family protein n=1 Tax=Flectobacillus major TaxID=103 RepID=UPI0004287DAC|nr:phage holin family protein [Flectobacillus major]
MVNFIIKYLLIALAVMAGARYINGIVIDSFSTSLMVAIAMGFVNTFLKPILKIISLPITFLTLGLFLLVINVVLVYLVAYFVQGFTVHGFIPPLLFSFGLSIISTILGWILD